MKYAVIAILLATAGCSGHRPAGGCQYGDAGGESWLGKIVQMEVLDDASGPVHVILVEGDHTEEFRLKDADYQSCLAPLDLEVGSEVTVKIKYGGPCPPMRRIMECPFGG